MGRRTQAGSTTGSLASGVAIVAAMVAMSPWLHSVHHAAAPRSVPASSIQLTGQWWQTPTGCELSVTKPDPSDSRLLLRYSAPAGKRECLLAEGKELSMRARFVTLGGRVFLDVTPRDHRQMLAPTVHSLFLVAFEGDSLLLAPPSAGWLKQSHLRHPAVTEMRLLAGSVPTWSARDVSNPDLQRFVSQHAGDGLFGGRPWRFERRAGPFEARP